MARLQQHHIRYDPEWKVELTRQMHSCIGSIQGTKATIEQYARVTNFMHAVTTEWNRMRMELDLGAGTDLRIVKPGRERTMKRMKNTKKGK